MMDALIAHDDIHPFQRFFFDMIAKRGGEALGMKSRLNLLGMESAM